MPENTHIQLNKKIYGSRGASDSLKRNFTEFKIKKYTIDEFFKLYNELFYDIPKITPLPEGASINLKNGGKKGPKGELNGLWINKGEQLTWVPNINSHLTIINQSKTYAGTPPDPLDKEIKYLNIQLREIQEHIDSIPDEHPYFKNGSLLIDEETHNNKYYIQSGRKRQIMEEEVWINLKIQQGFSKDTANWRASNPISQDGLDSIPSSIPINNQEDLNISTLEINRFKG